MKKELEDNSVKIYLQLHLIIVLVQHLKKQNPVFNPSPDFAKSKKKKKKKRKRLDQTNSISI